MVYGIFETKGREGKTIGYHVPRLFKIYGSRDWRRIYGHLGLRKWPRIFGIYRWWVRSEEDYVNAVNTLHELAKTHDFAFRAGRCG